MRSIQLAQLIGRVGAVAFAVLDVFSAITSVIAINGVLAVTMDGTVGTDMGTAFFGRRRGRPHRHVCRTACSDAWRGADAEPGRNMRQSRRGRAQADARRRTARPCRSAAGKSRTRDQGGSGSREQKNGGSHGITPLSAPG